MLRFAEEIMLLLLDDDGGEFVRVPEWSLQCALAGAVLMDLALENRIDTDLGTAHPGRFHPRRGRPARPDPRPHRAGNRAARHPLLDPTHGPARQPYSRASARASRRPRGILQRRDERLLWVFQSRRYPVVDGKADREVKLRIMAVLLSDEIPDPRDIVIVCLAEACGLFRELLSRRELEHATARIEQVRKLDLIGQAVSQAVWDIEVSWPSPCSRPCSTRPWRKTVCKWMGIDWRASRRTSPHPYSCDLSAGYQHDFSFKTTSTTQ